MAHSCLRATPSSGLWVSTVEISDNSRYLICMSTSIGSIALILHLLSPIPRYLQLYHRYPRSLIFVIIDVAEKAYLAGFLFLLAFVTLFPCMIQRPRAEVEVKDGIGPEKVVSSMEFLPLMVTSVYCAVGMFWGYFRLLFTYLNEKTYQGQLSTIQ